MRLAPKGFGAGSRACWKARLHPTTPPGVVDLEGQPRRSRRSQPPFLVRSNPKARLGRVSFGGLVLYLLRMMAKKESKQKEGKKIFIVDDHPVFREGLAGLIRGEADLAVCGEANSAAQALTAIERLEPDLVLVDIGLPGRSGLELIKDIRAVRSETAVLVISMHGESLYAERVLRAGGRGYIMKQEGPEKILQAIRHVLSEQLYLSGKMSVRILEAFSGRRARTSSPIGRL